MLVQPYNLMAHSFLLFLLFSYIISTNIHACKQTERSSLLSFASNLSSPPLNWTSLDCCHWKGITCDQDGWVTRLLLPSKGLKGGISPSSLGNLTHLTHLNVSHNSLYGSLEAHFFLSLNRLKILDLSYNSLYGELPLSLPSSSIRTIDLSSNHFFRAIPSSFFQQARNLTSFNVRNNAFTGYVVPSSICLHSSPSPSLLDFSFNVFSGNLAPGLGKCSKLQVFCAGHNNISGLLPEDIYNATKLEEIALPFNSLHGAISAKIVNLTNLAILDLDFNHFGGELPLDMGKLSKLKVVTLYFNNFEGALPSSWMNCTNLVELRLGSNHLEGDISKLDFSRLILTKLDMWHNNFTGTVPVSLYSCRSLKAIRIYSNHLKGQVQPEIVSLKSLSFLSLADNRFTNLTRAMKILMSCKSLHTLVLSSSFVGEGMPFDDDMVDFDGFQNLRFLGLVRSDLTGQIPVWLSMLKNLEILLLDFNQITGPIPSWLGTLPRLFYISLSHNRISGEFPQQLRRLPRLLYEPIASQVDKYEFELPIFSGSINANLTSLPQELYFYPPTIYLSKNNIVGDIPTEIGQLQLLQVLGLDSKNFSGVIPDQISNLKNLEVLNLSMNHLYGIIPPSMASLNFLKEFNVSYNDLEGTIPTSTQLQSFNASAFEGNSKLCGAPLPNKCGPNKDIDADNKNNKDVENGLHQLPWFYIFAALGFIVGFWGVCGCLIINKTWRYTIGSSM